MKLRILHHRVLVEDGRQQLFLDVDDDKRALRGSSGRRATSEESGAIVILPSADDIGFPEIRS